MKISTLSDVFFKIFCFNTNRHSGTVAIIVMLVLKSECALRVLGGTAVIILLHENNHKKNTAEER